MQARPNTTIEEFYSRPLLHGCAYTPIVMRNNILSTLVFLLLTSSLTGQNDAFKSNSIEHARKTFTLSCDDTEVNRGDSLILNYTVVNKSYLPFIILDSPLEGSSYDNISGRTLNYYGYFEGHHFTDFTFRIVSPGDSISEQIIIDTKTLQPVSKGLVYYSVNIYTNYINLTADLAQSLPIKTLEKRIKVDSEDTWYEFYSRLWYDVHLTLTFAVETPKGQ